MQLSLPFEQPPLLQKVRDLLLAKLGPQRDAQRHDPESQLIKAIISSKTRDDISDRAFGRLCAIMPSWDGLCDFPEDLLTIVIGDVQHAERKSQWLVATARLIRAKQGWFDLSFLAGWTTDDAIHWLRQLPGVDFKVASVVVNFS